MHQIHPVDFVRWFPSTHDCSFSIGQFSRHGCFSFILFFISGQQSKIYVASGKCPGGFCQKVLSFDEGSMRLPVASCDQGSKTRICVSAEKNLTDAFVYMDGTHSYLNTRRSRIDFSYRVSSP